LIWQHGRREVQLQKRSRRYQRVIQLSAVRRGGIEHPYITAGVTVIGFSFELRFDVRSGKDTDIKHAAPKQVTDSD
jgi:hypothetical protein